MILEKGILTFYLLLIFISCNNNNEGKITRTDSTNEFADTSFNELKSGLTIEPLLNQADNLQVLYYNNPDGDSLRYARFYKFLETNDSIMISQILRNLDQPANQRLAVNNCRSEGKIYILKNQEPLKTVYFSTRCDSCCYLYFIKDGAFFYFNLSNNLKITIQGKKAQSQDPGSSKS